MDINTSSTWLRVSIVDVIQGAVYEDIIYDQDLVVRTAKGEVLKLFDMTPMIATDVHPGDSLDVIVAISSPANLKWESVASSRNVAVIDSIDYEPLQDDSARFRTELFERRWCGLKTSMGYFLMALSEFGPNLSNEIALGKRLSWENGRFDLMAWKRIT